MASALLRCVWMPRPSNPPDSDPARDETAAIQFALDHPIGAAPLAGVVKPGETVAILVNDITRLARSDLFLPPIVNTLNGAGVPDADIFVVFALGTHRAQTDEGTALDRGRGNRAQRSACTIMTGMTMRTWLQSGRQASGTWWK